jgi:hypothetical protein
MVNGGSNLPPLLYTLLMERHEINMELEIVVLALKKNNCKRQS